MNIIKILDKISITCYPNNIKKRKINANKHPKN